MRAFARGNILRKFTREEVLGRLKANHYSQHKTAQSMKISQTSLRKIIVISGLERFIENIVRNGLKKYNYNKFLTAKRLGMDLPVLSATIIKMPERKEIERRIRNVIESALARNGFFVSKAARELGAVEITLSLELRKIYGINAHEQKGQLTLSTLEKHLADRRKAAKELGLSAGTVSRRIQKRGLKAKVEAIRKKADREKAEEFFSAARKAGSFKAVAEKQGINLMTLYKRASRARRRFPRTAR